MNRRHFIQLSSFASASLFVPRFLQAAPITDVPTGTAKKLVVVQLSGGNDGLNTVIPVRNDLYYASRPAIAIAREKTLALTDEVALHPSLAGLKSLYDSGNLTILNGVGYPEPDRSHFRSMDIWQSATDSDKVLSTGWLGRYLDGLPTATDARNTTLIEVDDTLSLALKGAQRKGLAVPDAKRFATTANDAFFRDLDAHAAEHSHGQASYLYKTLRETTASAEYVLEHVSAANISTTFPDTPLGKRFRTIASLLLSGADTQVYYISHGSFDTHAGQTGQHANLLKQLDEALSAFAAALKQAGKWDDTLVMTFSEFGRRVAENKSKGTDHGTAAPMFLLGGALKKPGLYNKISDLSDLDEGDLKHTLDFRSVYATVLSKWLGARPATVLGEDFSLMPLI